jgi:hypothetical protein
MASRRRALCGRHTQDRDQQRIDHAAKRPYPCRHSCLFRTRLGAHRPPPIVRSCPSRHESDAGTVNILRGVSLDTPGEIAAGRPVGRRQVEPDDGGGQTEAPLRPRQVSDAICRSTMMRAPGRRDTSASCSRFHLIHTMTAHGRALPLGSRPGDAQCRGALRRISLGLISYYQRSWAAQAAPSPAPCRPAELLLADGPFNISTAPPESRSWTSVRNGARRRHDPDPDHPRWRGRALRSHPAHRRRPGGGAERRRHACSAVGMRLFSPFPWQVARCAAAGEASGCSSPAWRSAWRRSPAS